MVINSIKCWICDNSYVDNVVKVRDHCHTTGKYRGSSYRDCNINHKSNHKFLIVFHNRKNYDSYLVMQELLKVHFKISVYQWNRKIYELSCQ